jgi:hypothetical protein
MDKQNVVHHTLEYYLAIEKNKIIPKTTYGNISSMRNVLNRKTIEKERD